MRILKNLPQKMKIEEATKMMGNAFNKKPWEIKKFYKNLDSREAKIIKTHSGGSLTKKQVEQLFKDTKEKGGFYYSKTKAQKAFNEITVKKSGKNAEDKKQRLIEYGKKRTRMAERLEKVKTGRLIDSKQDQDDPTANKKNEKINRIHNIKINASLDQNQNNPNTAANSRGGWTVNEQGSGLNSESKEQESGGWATNEAQGGKNSKKAKKAVPQEEQPLDMFID